jgi:hypothetical protein
MELHRNAKLGLSGRCALVHARAVDERVNAAAADRLQAARSRGV